MPFRDKRRLDPSQVEDVRGRRVGTGAAIGGGGIGIGILLLVVSLVLGVNPADLAGVASQLPSGATQYEEGTSTLAEDCQTGADANERADCRVVGFVNSIQAYWSEEFERRGGQYQLARTQLFSDATQAACGYATAASGPFYCPPDQKVYLDLAFFEELQSRFGAQGGPFAEAYVLAHEYGHHVQNLIGVLDQAGRSNATGPTSAAVRVELMADCLAGVWAHNAEATGYLSGLTEADIATSLDAASAVGDDRIQKQTQGRVSPESWTHGSSAQRQEWFKVGLRTGDLDACDTFATNP
ncbi:MAG: KPN_02809 family neutral zinc metallopeptidase [Chloroflexota bacterium]